MKIQNKKILAGLLPVFLGFALQACKVTEGTPPIGQNFAGPVDVLLPTDDTLYISNSNYSQEFFSGNSVSILDVSNPAEPVITGALPTLLFNSRMTQNTTVVPNRFFVANRFSFDNLDIVDQVYVYEYTDPRNPELVRTIDVADDPLGMDIVPAGPNAGIVLVTHASNGVVKYFDGNDLNGPVHDINLWRPFFDGNYSTAIAVSPDGTKAAVTNLVQNFIYVIDLSPPDDFTVEAILQVNFAGLFLGNFRDVAWLDNDRFVASNRALPGIVVFDLSRINEGGPIPDDEEEKFLTVDGATGSAVQPIPMLPAWGDPLAIVVIGDEVYVAETAYNQIRRVNLTTVRVEDPIWTGGFAPVAMRLAPGGQYLYVANQNSNSIGIIDVTTNELVGFFP